MVELGASAEEVRQRGEGGGEQPDERDDEKPLSHADGRRGPARRSSASPKPLVIAPAARNGQTGSLYQSATPSGRARRAEVLGERADEVERAGRSIAMRRGGPMRAKGLVTAPRRPGTFAASVKRMTRSPACRTSSPCGKTAAPSRTIAPISAP